MLGDFCAQKASEGLSVTFVTGIGIGSTSLSSGLPQRESSLPTLSDRHLSTSIGGKVSGHVPRTPQIGRHVASRPPPRPSGAEGLTRANAKSAKRMAHAAIVVTESEQPGPRAVARAKKHDEKGHWAQSGNVISPLPKLLPDPCKCEDSLQAPQPQGANERWAGVASS